MTDSPHADDVTATLPPAICIMGPTASGKTGLAMELVQRLSGEIISVDSAMVYRGMDIGTAKPDAQELRRAPHRLIDFLDPAETYSAARFREDALQEMEQIRAQGGLPLLVGGTMLYFRALQYGLSVLPAADPDIRAALENEIAVKGLGVLHDRLAAQDPSSAARIHRNDPQRIQRALEVMEITGKPFSQVLQEERLEPPPWRLIKLALAPADRETLHERIAQRFHTMLENGFLDEVRDLYARGDLHSEMPSMRAVGYRQAWDYLDGRLSYDEFVERAIIATRQYAKRQFTWLRSEQGLTTLAGTPAQMLAAALTKIRAERDV